MKALLRAVAREFNAIPLGTRMLIGIGTFLAIALNILPVNWLMFVPIAFSWAALAAFLVYWPIMFLEEWTDDE